MSEDAPSLFRHGPCFTRAVLKLISVASALVLVTISRLVSAQAAGTWRDSTDYLAPSPPSTGAAGVNPGPQQQEPSAPSVKPYRAWYGSQVLMSDAVTVSVLGAGLGLALSDGSNAFERSAAGFIWVGALGYALVPATIHVLHQRPAIALLSATMRVGMPAFGLIVGALSQCPITPDGGGGEKCDSDAGALIGLFAGIALATLNDAAWLSYDAPRAKPIQAAQFGLAPFLSQDGKRGELRAYGTF